MSSLCRGLCCSISSVETMKQIHVVEERRRAVRVLHYVTSFLTLNILEKTSKYSDEVISCNENTETFLISKCVVFGKYEEVKLQRPVFCLLSAVHLDEDAKR